jgi:hypothetical protein
MYRRPVAKALPLSACLVLCAGVCPAMAGSVVSMSLPAMAELTGQAIIGKVASKRSYWAEHPRRIETELVFSDVEYLKGEMPGSAETFTLILPGGVVGDMQMRIGCAPEFEIGQRWYLMLLPTYKTFPIVGLSQGCFLIRPDAAGVERLYTPANKPLTGFDSHGFAVSKTPARPAAADRVIESAGVRVLPRPSPEENAEALSLEAFRAAVRPILEASRHIELAEPAGRRVLVEYTPVRLQWQEGLPAARPSRGAGRAVGARTSDRPAKVEQP